MDLSKEQMLWVLSLLNDKAWEHEQELLAIKKAMRKHRRSNKFTYAVLTATAVFTFVTSRSESNAQTRKINELQREVRELRRKQEGK